MFEHHTVFGMKVPKYSIMLRLFECHHMSYIHVYYICAHCIDRVVNLVQKEKMTAILGVTMKGKTLCLYYLLKRQPKCV